MAILEGIQAKIRAGQFEFSQHAVDQSIIRHIGEFWGRCMVIQFNVEK